MRVELGRMLRQALERVTGWHVLAGDATGTDVLRELAESLPALAITTVFDVGANVGQSTAEFTRRLPGCRVFSFEPVHATFGELRQNVASLPRIQCFQIGFGSEVREADMYLGIGSDLASLSTGAARTGSGTLESVRIDTIDRFCSEHSIDGIDFLKIDTEGHDLEVLRGAAGMLRTRRIQVIQVEAGMSPTNELHVPFEVLKAFLEEHDFYVFRVYDQMHEWKTRRPHLRRLNAVFISSEQIALHAGESS